MKNKLKLKRSFLPECLTITNWSDLEHYFIDLKSRPINTPEDLKNWLNNKSELDSVLEEELAWRYIKMNCDTTNEVLAASFNTYVTEIEPKIAVASNELDKKLIACSISEQLNEPGYQIMMRSVKQQINLFRKENIPLKAELAKLEQEYGTISSLMMITYNDKEMTLQEAGNYLKNTNRSIRKEVFDLIAERRLQDKDTLDELLSKLISLRHKIAVNAGFKNYLEYKFAELGRFDYSVDDVLGFHKAIAAEVKPLVEKIHANRKATLAYDELKPYDLAVDTALKDPLKPFETAEELVKKTIQCFNKVDPSFGSYLATMDEMGYLDLEARKGKAPGGFNYPLYESNVPFIYMNTTGNLRDLETMVHEGGHAIHSFLSAHLPIVDFKSTPSEVAELASMSMELLSMKFWDLYFTANADLVRAKKSQLEGVIEVLPWVATVDKFQHWLYTNPEHSISKRKDAWIRISKEFGSAEVDWSDYEMAQAYTWQKQLHIFEVPFYYIEYAMAQLGAIGVWKNFEEDAASAIKNYTKALTLGYTKTIPEIYSEAGVSFNFTREYIHELMSFVKTELKKLE